MSGRRVLAFLVARPLIAVAIAVVVVGVLSLLQTHKQTTPVTERTQHVGLSDTQQTSSATSSTRRHCGRTGRRSSRPAPSTRTSGGWPRGSRPSPVATSPRFIGG